MTTMKEDNEHTSPTSHPSSFVSPSSSSPAPLSSSPPMPTLSRSSSSSSSGSTSSIPPIQDYPTTTTSTTQEYLNNPTKIAPIYIDTNAPIPTRNAQIIKAITTICPNYSSSEIQIMELGGGLSNHLFTASFSSNLSPLLIRIHPTTTSEEEENSLINREYETNIMSILSSKSIAPTFFGRFLNGRIEEFLEGVRPLTCHEVVSSSPEFGVVVARAMGELHLVTDIPKCGDYREEEDGAIVGTIEKWMDMAQRVLQREEKREEERVQRILDDCVVEWKWLYNHLFTQSTTTTDANEEEEEEEKDQYAQMATSFLREVVFTHMDCQSLNILTPTSNDDASTTTTTTTVKLIDFEYASHNRRAIDIANTFCECCDMNNLCPNYPEEYPCCERQDAFLMAYVAKVKPELAMELDEEEQKGGWERFLRQARMEVGRHALVSHLSWCIWSIVQWGNGCGIEFDYVGYAELRMEGYVYFKRRFWDS